MRRALDDGSTVWFLVNHAMEPFDAALSLPGGGVRSLDLYTGEVKPIPHTAKTYVGVNVCSHDVLGGSIFRNLMLDVAPPQGTVLFLR